MKETTYQKLQRELKEMKECLARLQEDIDNLTFTCECRDEYYAERGVLKNHMYDIYEELDALEEDAYYEMLDEYWADAADPAEVDAYYEYLDECYADYMDTIYSLMLSKW